MLYLYHVLLASAGREPLTHFLSLLSSFPTLFWLLGESPATLPSLEDLAGLLLLLLLHPHKVQNFQNNKTRFFDIHIWQFDSKPICSCYHFFKSLMLLFFISGFFFFPSWLVTNNALQGRNQTTPLLGRLLKHPLLVSVSRSSGPQWTPGWWFIANLPFAMFKDKNKIFISRVPFVKSPESLASISWYLKGCF